MRSPRRWAVGCLIAFVALAAAIAGLRHWTMRRWNEFLCLSQLKSLGLACAVYTNDYGGRIPPGMKPFADYACRPQGWGDFVPAGPPIFHCPFDPDQKDLRLITNTALDADGSCRCSYDCRLAYPPIPAQVSGAEPLLWDIDGGNPNSPRANHRHGSKSYGNVVYCDGHYRRVPAKDWPAGNRPPSGAARARVPR